jgi:molybdate transport system substrate-binding protein
MMFLGIRSIPLAKILVILLGLTTSLIGPAAIADEARIAVATNFTTTLNALKSQFETETGHTLIVITGSTGQLYAQITHGAPYDVFLSADEARPQLLLDEGLAIAGSGVTYASGNLVLWSANPGLINSDGLSALQAADFRTLAIANPALAPYGAAGLETLTHLDFLPEHQDKIVMGQNIAQTYALIATGNADLGLISRAQLLQTGKIENENTWTIPVSMHAPIRQNGVLLQRGSDNQAAIDFMTYLSTRSARNLISTFGYTFDDP